MNSERIELLAPAGNMECLHAAVRAGADAVYLGTERFNARRGADNFTLQNLQQACDYAHLRGARIYLTVNTAVLPSETTDVLELIRQAYRTGVDAFIVQDIGIAAEISRTLPQARLHASTQMNTHDAAGVAAAAQLGVKRITLARELSLAEIAELSSIAREQGIQIEAFAHGALCICYSGQCLMSSLIGGRSANRGMCAQACRLPYELHNRAVRKPLDAPGEHLLSPKDLCTIDLLPELAACGVASLKIEGRMKSPEYVSAVVGVYRAVLDRVLAWRAGAAPDGEPPAQVRATEAEHRTLSEAFSRGFTTAYLTDDTGNDMMSYGRPNNRGVFVGRVSDARGNDVVIDAEQPLQVGDVIEFWTNKGHFAHTIDHMEHRKNGAVALEVSKRVGKGDRVFRVRSAAAAYTDEPDLPKVPLDAAIALHIGRPAQLTLAAPDGSTVAVQGPVVEAARTKAVTAAEVAEHVNRMGNTPFEMRDLDVRLDEGVGMGFSVLHKLRATAVDRLEDEMLADYRARELPRTERANRPSPARREGCLVAAWATNPACARAAKKAGADIIYVPALNYGRGEAVVAGQRTETVEQAGYPNKVVIALPTVVHDPVGTSREARFGFDPWAYVKSGKPVLADNLGQVVRAADRGAQVEVGPHVPVLNALAVQALSALGASRIWLSPELSLGQIQDIAEESPVPLGLTIMGANELMVTEHCLLMSQGPCNRDCGSCARRKSPHYLKDRKDYEMTVVTDCCGRSHLYNAVPLDLAHLAPDLIRAGVGAFMVDTTLMNVSETTEATRRAVRARDIALKGGNQVSKSQGTTTGHIFRGIS